MSRSTRRGLLTCATMLLVLAIAVPALAGGSAFGYSGSFRHRLVSRSYSAAHSGQHTIGQTGASCPGPGNTVQYRIVRERLGPDLFYAWKNFPCGGGTRSWAVADDGSFHFDAEKADSSDTTYNWQVTGNLSYP